MFIVEQLKKNWKSGLSVALVSVPLSISLGIAAGASPVAGIITAIWAEVIAGVVGGSQFNIVGPAGALAGILASYALVYGAGILPIIALLAGIMTLIVWALGWDKYLIFVPSSVVHGFTLGVAFTIGFGQLNFALGLTGLPTHEKLISNILESFAHISQTNVLSLIPFLIGLAIMFALLKFKPRWPNSVIVAVLGIIFGYAATAGYLPFTVSTLYTKYGNLDLHLFSFPTFSLSSINLAIIQNAAVVMFVVVLETLISAKIADGMTKTKFRQRREVLGVGLANIFSGMFGGLPASGVFARTALNVKSGATSSYSQVINAVCVAIIAFFLLPGFKYLPLSIIASILVYVAIRMVAAEHFKKLYKYDRSAFWISIAVALITVFFDATMGILVGTLVSLLFFAKQLSNAQCNITVHDDKDVLSVDPVSLSEMKGEAVVYRFAGELTYINAKAHIERLSQFDNSKALILNFRNLFYIDVDGIEALDEIFESLERKNISVFVTGVSNYVHAFIHEHAWFKKLEGEKRVLTTTHEAVSKVVTLGDLESKAVSA